MRPRLFHVRRHTRAHGAFKGYVLNGHTRKRASGTYETVAAAEAQRAKLQNRYDEKKAAGKLVE